MRVFIIFLSLILFSVFLSCNQEVKYERNIPVNAFGWSLDDTVQYIVDVDDTLKPYDLFVNIRHRDIYRYMNIYVRIISIFPDGYEKNEVVSVPLCDEGGRWYGKCAGDICSQRVRIMKRLKFEQKGKYVFKINHEMRVNELNNILDVGLMINEHEKKEYVKED